MNEIERKYHPLTLRVLRCVPRGLVHWDAHYECATLGHSEIVTRHTDRLLRAGLINQQDNVFVLTPAGESLLREWEKARHAEDETA